MNKKKVSVVKCDSYDSVKIRKALLDSLKNIGFKFEKGKRVLIKPNLLSAASADKAITTNPIVVEELCKILKEKGIEIIIGESSAMDTDKALKVCGMSKLSKYGKVVNFEAMPKKFFNLGEKVTRVPLPKIVFDVDLVISLAKMKTHGLTHVTLCVKNLYGCVPGKLKENYHRVFPDVKDFSKFLFNIHEKIKPGLNIIDGVMGLEGEGPGSSGKPIKAGVILAGRDASAVDIVGSEIMGFKPNTIFTNKFSKIKKKDIEVVGNGKEVKLKFKKPSAALIPFFMNLYMIVPKSKICFDREKCIKCGKCERKCPVNAIKLKPWPECNHDKCILCLCCVEICPQNAIYLKDHWIRRALVWVVKKLGLRGG